MLKTKENASSIEKGPEYSVVIHHLITPDSPATAADAFHMLPNLIGTAQPIPELGTTRQKASRTNLLLYNTLPSKYQ
jgi:hypothetical protein